MSSTFSVPTISSTEWTQLLTQTFQSGSEKYITSEKKKYRATKEKTHAIPLVNILETTLKIIPSMEKEEAKQIGGALEELKLRVQKSFYQSNTGKILGVAENILRVLGIRLSFFQFTHFYRLWEKNELARKRVSLEVPHLHDIDKEEGINYVQKHVKNLYIGKTANSESIEAALISHWNCFSLQDQNLFPYPIKPQEKQVSIFQWRKNVPFTLQPLFDSYLEIRLKNEMVFWDQSLLYRVDLSPFEQSVKELIETALKCSLQEKWQTPRGYEIVLPDQPCLPQIQAWIKELKGPLSFIMPKTGHQSVFKDLLMSIGFLATAKTIVLPQSLPPEFLTTLTQWLQKYQECHEKLPQLDLQNLPNNGKQELINLFFKKKIFPPLCGIGPLHIWPAKGLDKGEMQSAYSAFFLEKNQKPSSFWQEIFDLSPQKTRFKKILAHHASVPPPLQKEFVEFCSNLLLKYLFSGHSPSFWHSLSVEYFWEEIPSDSIPFVKEVVCLAFEKKLEKQKNLPLIAFDSNYPLPSEELGTCLTKMKQGCHLQLDLSLIGHKKAENRLLSGYLSSAQIIEINFHSESDWKIAESFLFEQAPKATYHVPAEFAGKLKEKHKEKTFEMLSI